MNALIKPIQKESDKHYNYIFVTINALIKNKEKRKKFFNHLIKYVKAEIELEGFCNG